jgi:flagellar hook protein FlgE
MGLTSAMFTGLSGLNANQLRIDTVGDNIANVNTTAFKENRASFQNQFAITLNGGTQPGATSGGTNPSQVGRGTILGSIQRNFLGGPLETTGVPTDMAIQGSGFFIVNAANNQTAYTRDGTFKRDANSMLVSSDGYQVQGYGVDSDFNIVPGKLTSLMIPLGTLSTARASTSASFDGNLNSDGPIAAQSSILYSQALQNAGGAAATGDTLLTDLRDPASPAAAMFADGDVITLTGAKKGGREIPDQTFNVTAGTTLNDYLGFLNNALGINADPSVGGTPGIRVSDTAPPAAGTIIIEGNRGTDNSIDVPLSSIRSTNPNFTTPFNFTEQQAASGQSLYTTFLAFDSLGTPVQVNVTMTLENKATTGNTWRFYAESPDDSDPNKVLGTGTLTFDNDGRLTDVTNDTVQLNRANTGAIDPLQIKLDFANVTGLTTQSSAMVMTQQDGYPTGTLTDFSVGGDGVLTGTFSNGLNRQLGQVALATFTNPEGLVGGVNNLFYVGANSGQPIVTTPDTLGSGQVVGGALELSNVDLTREFIGLITASTGFSASGRVISTSNDLLNELLTLAR